MPSKLDCVKSGVENILIMSNNNKLPKGFLSLPYRFFSLKSLNTRLDGVSYINEMCFDIDIKIDAVVCDEGNLVEDAFNSAKNIGSKLIYIAGLDDDVILPEDIIVVNQTSKTKNRGHIVFPTDIFPFEIPDSKKYNISYCLNESVPNEIKSDNLTINECSIYLNVDQKDIDYHAIHALGCGTLVISVANKFTEKFLSQLTAVIVNNKEEAIQAYNYYVQNVEATKSLRVNGIRSYREKFSREMFEKRWGDVINEC